MSHPDRSRHFFARLFTYLTWMLILGGLFLYFQNLLQQRENPNQSLAVSQTQVAAQTVSLTRNRRGHYVAPGLINETPVTFLLDTGATDISIPAAVLDKLYLKAGHAIQAHTANGTVTVYATTLDSVTLGGITLYDVAASINPHMKGDTVLLGMSFMKHLEITQRGDTLTLRR